MMFDPERRIGAASQHGADRQPLFPEYPGVTLTEADVMARENAQKTLRQIAAEKYARIVKEES